MDDVAWEAGMTPRGSSAGPIVLRVVAMPRRRREPHTEPNGVLVNGLLVLGGAAGAVKLDEAIEARPLGLPPSAFVFAGSLGMVFVAQKYKRPDLARHAVALTIGIATGLVGSHVRRR